MVDVATHLTVQGRKASRRGGKDDEGDGVVIARVALRDPGLPRLTEQHLDADLKLLVDARDQLVAEATRVRNRLHALLLVIAPGYRDDTGALSNKSRLDAAKQLVVRGRVAEGAVRWESLGMLSVTATTQALHRHYTLAAMWPMH